MTTRVTVDAHAGWPVMVVIERSETNFVKTIETETVEPMTQRDFYIHSSMKILSIFEQPR